MEKEKLGNKQKFLRELSEELNFVSRELSSIHSVDNTREIKKVISCVENISRSLEGISLHPVNEQLMKLEEFLGILLKWPADYDLSYLHKLNLLVKSIQKNVLLSLEMMENQSFTANLINSLNFVSFSENHTDMSQKALIKEKVNEDQLTLYRSNIQKLKRNIPNVFSSFGGRVGKTENFNPEKALFDLVNMSNKFMCENKEFKQAVEEFVEGHISASSVSIENDFVSVVEDCNRKAKELGKPFFIITEFEEMRAHVSKAQDIVRYFKNHMLFIINFLPAKAACRLEVKARTEKHSLIFEISAKLSINGNARNGGSSTQGADTEKMKELKEVEQYLNIFKRAKKFDNQSLASQMIMPALPGIAEVYFAKANDSEFFIPSSLVEKFIPLRETDLKRSGEGYHYSLEGEQVEAWCYGNGKVKNAPLVGVLTYNQNYEKCLVVFDQVGDKELVRTWGEGKGMYAAWGDKHLPVVNICKNELNQPHEVETLKTA